MNNQDIKNLSHYFTIIIVYGVILGIVYGYWMYREDLPIWSFILVGLGFVLVSVIVSLIYVELESRKEKKNLVKEEEKTVESNQ